MSDIVGDIQFFEPVPKREPMNKNAEQLQEFTEYCAKNPGERFWQALRNWSGYANIYGLPKLADWETADMNKLEDTFYKK